MSAKALNFIFTYIQPGVNIGYLLLVINLLPYCDVPISNFICWLKAE